MMRGSSHKTLRIGSRDLRKFSKELARASAGGILFALPLLMTMEMWQLGLYMNRARLALMMVAIFPLLAAISRYSGFERTTRRIDDVVDAFVAYGVAIVASAFVLALFNQINASISFREVVAMVGLQSVPAAFGAILANSQLKGGDTNRDDMTKSEDRRYHVELLLMAAGAVFLAFNIAPTEEIVLIASKMTRWHCIVLALVSLLLMHAFVYSVEFRGQKSVPTHVSRWSHILRFSVAGYALALLVSAYVLWTFGRLDHHAFADTVAMIIVLGFPASIGAAAARLIL